jgi:hypothetical protein
MASDTGRQPRGGSRGRRVLYWFAVGVVSIALVVALLLLLQSRDSSTVGFIAAGWE